MKFVRRSGRGRRCSRGKRARVGEDAGVLLGRQPRGAQSADRHHDDGMNAARPMFNNLVEFAPGTTRIVPALAESWTISDDGTVYTFKLRAGVKFHSNRIFKPTRDMNADDVVFSLLRQWKEDHPYHKRLRRDVRLLQGHGHARALEGDREGRRAHGAHHADAAGGAVPRQYGDGRSTRSSRRNMRTSCCGPARRSALDQEPIGTGPFVFVSYQKDVAVRYRAFPDYWGGRQPIDTLVFSITPNPLVRLTKLKAGECQVMAFPESRRRQADRGQSALQAAAAGRPERRLSGAQHCTQAAVRRRARAPRDQHGDRQGSDHRRGLSAAPARSPRTRCRRRCGPTTTRSRTILTIRRRRSKLLAEAGHPAGLRNRSLVHAGQPPLQSERQAHRRDDPGRSRQGRHPRAARHRRMDRATARSCRAGEHSMALYGWTGDNGDPDNFMHMLLGCTAARTGGNNISKWCDRGLRRAGRRAPS